MAFEYTHTSLLNANFDIEIPFLLYFNNILHYSCKVDMHTSLIFPSVAKTRSADTERGQLKPNQVS